MASEDDKVRAALNTLESKGPDVCVEDIPAELVGKTLEMTHVRDEDGERVTWRLCEEE